MNGKKIIKPFDLEAAKNGAKIETRDGREVEILKWDAENTSYPIEGVILRSKATWANNGKWSIADPQHCHHDLVIVEHDGEDKDEKIRKALVDFFSRSAARGEQTGDVDDKDILAWLERQGEKSQEAISEDANKTKPKFQVGDWIVEPREGEPNGLWRIERIKDGRYWTRSCGVRIEYADKHYHLWSIEDVKDGDAFAWWFEKQVKKMQEVMWKDFKEKIKAIQRGDRD